MSRSSLSAWLRVACGLGLVALLLWHAAGHEALGELRHNPPSVPMLAAAWAAVIAAIVLAIFRWRLVAEAAGIPLSVAESLRLGAIGFACNFVALGSVGGDVVKATLLAKPRPGQRAAAVTTVLVDRMLGLVGYLAYAALAILWTGSAWGDEPTTLRVLSQSTLVVAAVATGGLLLLFAPGRPVERLARLFAGAPVVGQAAHAAADLAALYRDGWRLLVGAMGVGLLMNGVFVLSFYLAAKSLAAPTPDLAEHFFVVPLAMISGAAPISPNGLGTIEATAEFLYRAVRPETPVGAGTLAALAHRLVMVLTGVVAAAYYYLAGGRRSDVAAAASAISSDAEAGSGTPAAGDDTLSRQTV